MTSCAGPGQADLGKPGDRVDRWMKPVCGPDAVQRETIGMQKVAKRTQCLLFQSDQGSPSPSLGLSLSPSR